MAITPTFFSGVVQSTDAATYNIQVAPEAGNSLPGLMQGIALSSSLAKFLGFKETCLPCVGTRVLCFSISVEQCYIIGACPSQDVIPNSYCIRTVFGQGDGLGEEVNKQMLEASSKHYPLNSNRATDVVSGEYVMGNELGVMLGLFQMFASLKGSELAQVQCFMLDDLVRIISHNFQHYTALGELKIFHDGKTIHLESGATHLPEESLGEVSSSNKGDTEGVFSSSTYALDDSSDIYNFSNQDEQRIAVERLKVFAGALGNFVNLMMVRPSEGNRYIMDGIAPGVPDRGLLQVHTGLDGGLHVRSLKEVFLEKTNWIRVPQRIRTPDDPNGDSESIGLVDKPAYVFDDQFTFSNQPFLYSLQLRDYLAYLHEDLNYRDFLARKKDFSVNGDISKEKSLSSITKVDPSTGVRYTPTTSGVYLMPNGGVMLKDAWGSAIIMEGGNIYLQAAKDLVAQPLRNLIGKVGQFTNIASQYDIDLSSTLGGMRIKTDKSQYLYSDNSGIILHSNTTTLSTGDPDPTSNAVQTIGGVVIKSKTGIYQYAPVILASAVDSIFMQAGHGFFAQGGSVAYLSAYSENGSYGTAGVFSPNGDVYVTSKSNLNLISDSSLIAVGKSSTVVGKKDQSFAVAKSGNNLLPVQGSGLNNDSINGLYSVVTQIHTVPFQEMSNLFTDNTSFVNLQFRFLASSDYSLNSSDTIPQTIYQQEYESLGPSTEYPLGVWNELPVNDTYPYPGSAKFTEDGSYVTSNLANLSLNTQDHSVINNTTQNNPLEGKSTLNNSSLLEYKVIVKF